MIADFFRLEDPLIGFFHNYPKGTIDAYKPIFDVLINW